MLGMKGNGKISDVADFVNEITKIQMAKTNS
jgi:hypothetical protein